MRLCAIRVGRVFGKFRSAKAYQVVFNKIVQKDYLPLTQNQRFLIHGFILQILMKLIMERKIKTPQYRKISGCLFE
jgi:hypothetical protein